MSARGIEIARVGRAAGKEPVSRFGNFEHDDKNDTLLFDKLEEYVLEHYPNPQRIGCLDHDALCAFVETPETLDLADLKYLHIFKCRECTRDLIELRRIRDERLRQSLRDSTIASGSDRKTISTWKSGFARAPALVRAVTVWFLARLGLKLKKM